MTEEQLKDVESHAGNLMSIDDIAIIIGVDVGSFKKEYEKKTGVYQAYQRGFLIRKSQLNKAAIEQAISGSSPALNQVIRIIENLPIYDK